MDSRSPVACTTSLSDNGRERYYFLAEVTGGEFGTALLLAFFFSGSAEPSTS